MEMLRIEKIVAGGDGLARDSEGLVVFVEGVLPGELAQVEITESKSDFRKGRAVSIIEPSKDRIEPECVHFNEGCGGCQWQFASIESQKNLKVEIVRDSLRRIAHLSEVSIESIKGVEPWGYRSTMRLIGSATGSLGLRRRHSNDVVEIPNCLVAADALADVIKQSQISPGAEVQIRSTGDSDISVMLEGDKSVAQFETVAGRKFRVGSRAFFQSGAESAQLLVEETVAICDSMFGEEPINIVDLYAGIGILGGSLIGSRNRAGDFLIAVESNETAVSDAQTNLAKLPASVINAEVLDLDWSRIPEPDLVIADPGRPGLGKLVVKAICAAAPEAVLLVSCDPASMARDCALMVDRGYKLDRVQPLDLFPQTSHIETVCLFSK